jgi:vitamin B12/bleomycin/antimicrobial peptide transport system ATP-binding/permease protein
LWRDWQTRQLLERYLANRVFYQLAEYGDLENPDQRITEDVRTFAITTLSFVLMTMNAIFTVIAFSGVLWAISPRLFFAAVIYASIGSLLTLLLGRRLIGLNDQQFDKEANFRSELMHVRENAESIAMLHREGRLYERLLRRLDDLMANSRRMIAVNRNLGFFTTGYNYIIQIIPALIVAPLFMKGRMEFGVITQSAMAFALLMGAFSLIVTQFQSISSYAAVIARLGKLIDAMDDACTAETSTIKIEENGNLLRYENLTLFRDDGRVLVKQLSLSIAQGTRVMFSSFSGHAKAAIFKASAGLYCHGQGRIVRPDAANLQFLPDRPYLPKGTLREVLVTSETDVSISDDEMMKVLQLLKLDALVTQSGGLDSEHDWSNSYAVNELATLAFARILLAKPQFVFLDRLSISMEASQSDHLLQLLTDLKITYLMLGKPEEPLAYFDAVLTIENDGSWSYRHV